MTIPDSARDAKTPASVAITMEAPPPTTDPTLGVAVKPTKLTTAAKHRFVTIGDSLTHGFQSLAIYNTHLSWPMIVAWEMGWDRRFRYPRYEGMGGLPLNLELLIRRLERKFGSDIAWWELAAAGFAVRSHMDQVEDYWERGPGSTAPTYGAINHNLAIYGWDLRDALSRTSKICANAIKTPKDDFLKQIVENANDRAALRVLPPPSADAPNGMTPIDAARSLGGDGGIETLIVFLGANNALASVVSLKVAWSEAPDYADLNKKSRFTVWAPDHFLSELDQLVAEIGKIDAQHVIWATVPHVTIAPVARGVGKKVRPGSRYFPYYTRPWITDEQFDPREDPCITEGEARAVDCAIDQYNQGIRSAVKEARRQGKDWYLIDTCGILDRLAFRRYRDDLQARPDWWTPYELPPALDALTPKPDTRFFASGPSGRTAGGIIALDGIHPTTIGYGIVAQEMINVMQQAGVIFYQGDGTTPRQGPVQVDFQRLIRLDSLISDPPKSLTADVALLGWLDEYVDVLSRILRSLPT